jgi:hypothetical protein
MLEFGLLLSACGRQPSAVTSSAYRQAGPCIRVSNNEIFTRRRRRSREVPASAQQGQQCASGGQFAPSANDHTRLLDMPVKTESLSRRFC